MDSGSEITIMHISLFKRVFSNDMMMSPSDLGFIRSFSAGEIPILGMKSIHLQPDRYKPGIVFNMYIINDIPGVPIFLVGFNVFSQGMVDFRMTGNIEDPTPEIVFKFPSLLPCTVFYESPRSLDICIATEVSLKPYEQKWTSFVLSCAAPVIRTDIILITSRTWDTVNVVPSRTRISLVSPSQRYYGNALVANTSNEYVENLVIYARYELVNDYDMVDVSSENKDRLMHALCTYPFGREIITSGQNVQNNILVPTVNKISVPSEEDVMVSDLSYADTVMSKEPTYVGVADINHEIIEPSGIDIPTLIHSTAAEAIDLSVYSEEVRPFIQDIFINKYPQVVSLHSLDAGNLSLTLGLTQLRLREGEKLPRAKRIFHISPSDQRHLDDICELLIKFGYISRSRMTPDGSHLYGMSAYLVPRSKPNCLGRLIVDFSPVNQLIQSPASVIPEINATLVV